MAYTIMIGNFKGGTGKTTNACLLAYTLANRDKKTLLVDLDPQANSTSLMMLTKERDNDAKTTDETISFFSAMIENKTDDILVEVKSNLYVIPSYKDFSHFTYYLEKKYGDDRQLKVKEISTILEKIDEENNFDYIIIDTPPTLSLITDNAVYSSDGIIIAMQTHIRSYDGAKSFIEYLQEFYDENDTDFDVIGVLPVIHKRDAKTDRLVMENANACFGNDAIFNTIVPYFERLKLWDSKGIANENSTDFDMHDKRVLDFYNVLVDELEERIKNVNR